MLEYLQAIGSLIQSLPLRKRRKKAEPHLTVQRAKKFKNIQVSITFAQRALQSAVNSLILTLLHRANSGVVCDQTNYSEQPEEKDSSAPI